MDNNELKSIKFDTGKKYKIMWTLLCIALIIVIIMSLVAYSNYKKAQEQVVDFLLEYVKAIDKISSHYYYSDRYAELYSENYSEMLDNLYEYVTKDSDTSSLLGELMSDTLNLDYTTFFGDEFYFPDRYLYNGYLEYIIDVDFAYCLMYMFILIIAGVLAVFTVIYSSESSKEFVVLDDKIIFKKGSSFEKAIYINTITSVSLTSSNGLIISTYNGDYKIKNLYNLEEFEKAITEKIAEASKKAAKINSTPDATNSPDEILKYKTLLDNGIITQEEFDSKKKELLGL